MSRRLCAALIAGAVIASRAHAQDPTPGADLPTDGNVPIHTPSQRFIALPVLRSAPATGVGGGVGLAMLFHSDSGVAPSAVGAGGVYSTNQSWAYGIGGRANLAHDWSRSLAGAADYRLRYDFWGVGTDAGNAGDRVRVAQRGDAEVIQTTFMTVPHLYVGPRYRRAHFTVQLDQNDPVSDLIALIARERSYLTSALGGTLEYDTRDNEIASTKGVWAHADAMFADPAFGGVQSFNQYDLTGEQFVPLSAHSVLAMRATVCDVTNGAPVWEFCLLGLGPDLRGYTAGRYRDHTLTAAQAEYRYPIWRRIGGVAFAGAGAVAPALDQLSWHDLLASGGVGLRYLVVPSARLNAGADYGIGKNGGAFYLRLGEAF